MGYDMLTPETTWYLLLGVQSLHLLHHRLAKRHISFAEVTSSAVLCAPLSVALPAWLLMGAHLMLVGVQVIGSIWIDRLAPNWSREPMRTERAGRRRE